MELGYDLGCSKFIMAPGRPLITTPVARGRELAVRSLGSCADFAKNYGMTVCIENSPFSASLLDAPDKMLEMLKDVSATNLSVRLDPCHCNVSKTDFRDFCTVLKGRIASIGIHDNKGDADSHLPIGWGNVKLAGDTVPPRSRLRWKPYDRDSPIRGLATRPARVISDREQENCRGASHAVLGPEGRRIIVKAS